MEIFVLFVPWGDMNHLDLKRTSFSIYLQIHRRPASTCLQISNPKPGFTDIFGLENISGGLKKKPWEIIYIFSSQIPHKQSVNKINTAKHFLKSVWFDMDWPSWFLWVLLTSKGWTCRSVNEIWQEQPGYSAKYFPSAALCWCTPMNLAKDILLSL